MSQNYIRDAIDVTAALVFLISVLVFAMAFVAALIGLGYLLVVKLGWWFLAALWVPLVVWSWKRLERRAAKYG